MSLPVFRVRDYAHPKYRFVVRAKVGGKWKRRYFTTKADAEDFARDQNRAATALSGNGARQDFVGSLQLAHPDKSAPAFANELVEVISAEYLGPKIKRYYGDHWSMHLPFAYDLMRELRPRTFVELGVWKGESYFAFCQSAAENNVAVKCYGVDSWRGDVHMGELDANIETEVKNYNQGYAAFSELKAKTFDEAVDDFADESIDLLHIDGAHTYEDVRRDFKSWLPKLSPTGVVLFHDVSVHGRGFGVWRLWQEIAVRKSSFVFEFGYGLGVWQQTNASATGSSFLDNLFQANNKERELINRRYATAASALALWETQQATESLLRGANEELETAREKLVKLEPLPAANLEQANQIETQQQNIEILRQNIGTLQQNVSNLQQALEERSSQFKTVQALEREQRARIEIDSQRLASYETKISELRTRLNRERKKVEQLATQLRARDEEHKAAAAAAANANKDLKASRAQTGRLRAALKISRTRFEGVQTYNNRLKHQLDKVAADLFDTGRVLRDGDKTQPAIFDLISADIDRIHHSPFWWKAMRSLGLLRLAAPGTPKTSSDRRTIAADLRAGLKEIGRTLSSKAVSAEEAGSDLRRLFELRHRAGAIADSLRFSKAFSRTSPPWTFISYPRRNASMETRAAAASALFDPAWYLGEYPDVAAAGIDPLTHYLTWGVQDGRNPNPLFHTAWYCGCNPDVTAKGINPVEHYLAHGAREERDPCPLFSTSWYLKQNPDLAAAGVNPLQHYLEYGIREGRDPHPLFNVNYYLSQAPEAEGGNPVEHYLKGGGWDVSPHPLFDVEWYLQQNPEIVGGPLAPLSHYLEIGARKGRDPHPLFDAAWYLDCNPDVRAHDLNPLVHYITTGSAEGRDPHPLFDTSWYRTQYADACPPGVDPLTHYVTRRAWETHNPHPLFDTSWYLRQNGDVAAAGANPLVHFWFAGGGEGRDPHPLFDSSWYLETNPDVRQNWMNPLWHYLSVGAHEKRDPHPLFQSKYYEEQRHTRQFSPLKLATSPGRRLGQSRESSKNGKKVVYAFTSICLNYIPKAIVLARTLKKHNPDIHFCVLISDRIPEGALDTIDLFDEVISINDLEIMSKPSWIFRHTVVELCTAVKGYFMVDLLGREDCAAAFYFDPDIVCFSSLELLTDRLRQASILLTPHLTDPEITMEAILDNEICALKHGVYNLGFLGLRPSAEGCRFARWWRDRLRDFCRADIPGGLFTDQRWVDLAPALFQEVEIIRHPGCNAATWNLTNRNIEGDFETGFTVNGQPLIFYHFSGFDSGAQGAMLDKYGGEMPAAQLLRKWYIQETSKSGESHFAQFPWTLGSFSNGTPITDAQRIIYRDRADLQEAFPNPFDADNRGKSYYHWYQGEVLGRPIGADGMGYNPLIEFIEAKTPLQPNPLFDCDWYLQRNPDVAAVGLNPLVHFIRCGADEGRQPNPNFYPRYYRAQLPPSDRSENPLAHYLLHGLREHRRTDPRYHPIADSALRNRIRRWANSGPPVIILVSHYGGGGTERHLRDLVDCVSAQAKFIQLTPGHDGFVRLFPRDGSLSSELIFDPAEQFDALVEVLRDCEPRRLHIHHVLGNEEYLAALVHELKRPFDFTIHDYYVLAPSPHLVGADARFVGDDLASHEDELLSASIAPRRPANLAAWQEAHAWLVQDAERVIAPSRDVARRFSRFFPRLNPIIAAHPEEGTPFQTIAFPPIGVDDTLRVALLGDFLRHKGGDIILECARIARAGHHKVAFELIGDPHKDAGLLAEAGIWASGRYAERDVYDLLKQRQPHLLWYPALCPESYSYTLSIGLASGLPLVVTDLGSLPERVVNRPWAWVCPWQLDSPGWVEFFLRIRSGHFLTAIPPQPRPGSPPPSSSFYYKDYLAVIDQRRNHVGPARNHVIALTGPS